MFNDLLAERFFSYTSKVYDSLSPYFAPFGPVYVLRQCVARIGVGPKLVHDQENNRIGMLADRDFSRLVLI